MKRYKFTTALKVAGRNVGAGVEFTDNDYPAYTIEHLLAQGWAEEISAKPAEEIQPDDRAAEAAEDDRPPEQPEQPKPRRPRTHKANQE
ncbi:MAG: hypothetical protein L0215_27275 [Gemmataceae bacterium]|nr:hypothetical protein [Gemmataceae bacterium]